MMRIVEIVSTPVIHKLYICQGIASRMKLPTSNSRYSCAAILTPSLKPREEFALHHSVPPFLPEDQPEFSVGLIILYLTNREHKGHFPTIPLDRLM
jgi:hypothetical protein